MNLDNYKFSVKTQVKYKGKWYLLSHVDFYDETVEFRKTHQVVDWCNLDDIKEEKTMKKSQTEGKKDYKTQSLVYDVINSALNILDTSDLLKDIVHNPNGGCHFTDPKKKLCAKCKLEEVRNQINNLRFNKYV